MDTAAIQRGLDTSATTGKPFMLPAGAHVVGSLRMRSGAHLRFADGAVLRMEASNAAFTPIERLTHDPRADQETSRFEYALLFAGEAERITIDGPGRIVCDRTARGGPKVIALRNVRGARVEGITIVAAPNHAIGIIGSRGVEVNGVRIEKAHADGIVVDASEDVRIADVDVESFETAICLKASLSLGKKMATRHITVERARLTTGSVFFKTGTESFGDFEHIRLRQVKMTGNGGNRHGNPGILLATVDGGAVRDVVVTDVEMLAVGAPLFLRIGDRSRTGPGEMSGIHLERVRSTGSRGASVFAGLPDSPIRKVRLKDVRLDAVPLSGPLNERQPVMDRRDVEPEVIQFAPIPASVLYARHVVDLKLERFEHRNAVTPVLLFDSVLGFKGKCTEVSGARVACR